MSAPLLAEGVPSACEAIVLVPELPEDGEALANVEAEEAAGDQAARNAQNQQTFIQFAQDPQSLPNLQVCTLTMKHLNSLMCHILHVDSPKWETTQRAL